jgi:hypothetical protein
MKKVLLWISVNARPPTLVWVASEISHETSTNLFETDSSPLLRFLHRMAADITMITAKRCPTAYQAREGGLHGREDGQRQGR